MKVFRVDNPHTKPLGFWEWLIARDHRRPTRTCIFLSEAFTRRARLVGLAKVGFSQSYTYFTWKNSRWDLEQFVYELLSPVAARGLPPELLRQHAGHPPRVPPARRAAGVRDAARARGDAQPDLRHLLGLRALRERPGPARQRGVPRLARSTRPRRATLDGPLLPFVQTVNEIRRANPALQQLDNITFLDTQNDGLIAYAKQAQGNTVITVVNLDPHHAQEGLVHVPDHLGLPVAFVAHDLLTDERYGWHLGANYVRLEPPFRQAHVLRVEGP